MAPNSGLAGTVALVTGASSGIGEATALALAAEGAVVSLLARRADRLDAVAAAVRAAGGQAHVHPADITTADGPATAVERIVADLGRLDVLVNAAGVMLVGPALDGPAEEWRRSVDLNVTALLEVTHAALPHLVAAARTGPREVADLVNVSSVAGRQAISGAAVYSATKFAVGAFGEALRQELGVEHVRVCTVEPGAVATELTDHIRPGVRDHIRSWYGAMETLHPQDVAEAVRYAVTRPRRTAVGTITIRPTEQV